MLQAPPDICGDKQWWEWRKSCSPQQRPLPRGIRTPPPNTLFTPTQHLVTKLPKPISCNLLRSTNHMCSIVWFQFVFIRIILQKKIHTAFEVLAGGSRLEDTYLAKWRKWRKTKHWSLSICATIMQISQISWKGKKIQRYGHRRMKIYSLQTVSDFSKAGTGSPPHLKTIFSTSRSSNSSTNSFSFLSLNISQNQCRTPVRDWGSWIRNSVNRSFFDPPQICRRGYVSIYVGNWWQKKQ